MMSFLRPETAYVLTILGIVFAICAACAWLAKWLDKPDHSHTWKPMRETFGTGIVWRCKCKKEVTCPRGYSPNS